MSGQESQVGEVSENEPDRVHNRELERVRVHPFPPPLSDL